MKPAARVGDPHLCPQVSGVTPHVGGPVLPTGSSTVFIGGLPAARVGDLASCAGPPDAIVTGSATVFIDGLPAARLGDATAHGGVIIGGCGTVLIGDGPAAVHPQATALREAARQGLPFCRKCGR